MANNYEVVFKGVDQGNVFRVAYKDEDDARSYQQGKIGDGTNRPLREVYNILAQGCTDHTALAICHLGDELIKEIKQTDENKIPSSLSRMINLHLEAAKVFMFDYQKDRAAQEAAEGKNTPKDVVMQVKAAVTNPLFEAKR